MWHFPFAPSFLFLIFAKLRVLPMLLSLLLLLLPHLTPNMMPDSKDSAIKLFGQTIPLPPLNNHREPPPLAASNDDSSCSETAAAAVSEEDCCGERSSTCLHHENNKSQRDLEEQEANRNPCVEEIIDDKQEDDTSILVTEDSKDQAATSGVCDNPKTPSVERETSSLKSSKSGEQSETSTSQEKTLKKPDKILPCPRCNSMDTKFCYYNNYNVNQPRHFCKNCQRYWTAGGTMRNVPVGAGRRKNKSSAASHYRQIMVSDAFRTAQVHALNGIHHSPSLGNNGAVLTFGIDSPLCESVSSMLNLSEKTQASFQKGYHRPQQRILVPCGRTADNGDDRSSGSSVTTSNSLGKGGHGGSQDVVIKNHQGFPAQIPCFPAPPWPCPWNPSGFPVSFYPSPSYWGCAVPSPWNAPSRISPSSPSLKHSTQSSSPTSPLGKHARDGNIIKPASSEDPSREHNSSERTVLVPKTLRIDDPNEAAKSCIWATLEIKSEKSSSINGAGAGLFKVFQSKKEDRNCIAEASPVLQANPAALSRSLKFRESA